MGIRVVSQSGIVLGFIYKTGIKLGRHEFSSIVEHKKFIIDTYGIMEDVRIRHNNVDIMSYYNANDMSDIIYNIQLANSKNIDMEIMKAVKNLEVYDNIDISRRLIKIGNDIRNIV